MDQDQGKLNIGVNKSRKGAWYEKFIGEKENSGNPAGSNSNFRFGGSCQTWFQK
ncbi:MAG: hypothetical protein NC417_11545 [Candidatus Gastranaerophilales bacterium]|nr:hypothetical protein [Candidatus Gastranaerophilales bacterium]